MSKYYILDGKKPKVVSIIEWARDRENQTYIVEHTFIREVLISTVFLGIDHYWGDDPDHLPILFETMIFEDPRHREEQWRYCTYDEAKEGHKKAVELVLEA